MDIFEQPKKTNSFLLFLLVVLVIAAGVIGYIFGRGTPGAVDIPTNEKPAEQVIVPTSTSAVLEHPTTTMPNVTWAHAVKIESLGLLPTSTSNVDSPYYEEGSSYYSVGSIVYNGKPAELIMLTAMPSRPDVDLAHTFLVRQDQKITWLAKSTVYSTGSGVSSEDFLTESINAAKVTKDQTTTVFAKRLPATLSKGTTRQTITLMHEIDVIDYPDSFTNMTVMWTDPTWGPVYTQPTDGAFYVQHGPLWGVYGYKPDIFVSDAFTIPAITWNDGTTNAGQYNQAIPTGCGFANYITVADSSIDINRDLVAVGKTNHGDTVYEYKDKNNADLKTKFEAFPTDPPLTYEEFLALRPLIFWVDPFGRLLVMQNVRFAPMAECGKPVIYLYPTHTMPVSVKLYPQGGFTYSDPPYNAGWDVVAEPNGTLHIGFASSSYPFLFWEGRGGIYEQPKQGWVVAKKNVQSFLTSKLTQLGLNATERRDFMDFWVPKMQAKPYYFVTFMGNQTMDTLAPLVVDPKPDTVIRILMDFTPLDKPISVKSYTIKTPVRKGFTVIEWGGVIRK